MSNKRRSEDSPRKTNMSMTAAQATDGSSRLQTMKQLKTEYSDLVKYNDDKLLDAKFKIGSVSDAAIAAAESVSTELNKQLALYLGTSNELARYGPMVRHHVSHRLNYHAQWNTSGQIRHCYRRCRLCEGTGHFPSSDRQDWEHHHDVRRYPHQSASP
jgi:hypothetical protein